MNRSSGLAVGLERPEAERNRVLRRVDWRFLLPTHRSSRSVCFAGGVLAEGVHLVSESTCQPRLATHCDLAVSIDPTPAQLRRAWDSLEPGGWYYTEWHQPWMGSKPVLRRLEAAGFENLAAYWCWPNPEHATPRAWLPLRSSGAFNYVLRTRPLQRGRCASARRALRRWEVRLGWWLGALRPICVVAEKPGRPADVVAQAWWRQGASTLGQFPATVHCLLLAGGARSIAKAVALVFADDQESPGMAVKLARVPEAAMGLRREASVLRALETTGASGLTGLPRVLFVS